MCLSVHTHTLPHIWLRVLCHSAGVCLEASAALLSPETCTGSFPGQTATTLPELAQYQTLHWNVVARFFVFFNPSFFSLALPR